MPVLNVYDGVKGVITVSATRAMINVLQKFEEAPMGIVMSDADAGEAALQNRVVGGYNRIYEVPLDQNGNPQLKNAIVYDNVLPEEGEIALETLSPKERFEFFLSNTGSDELIKAFADYVNETAIELMIKDNKVEGKHYAAMKLIMNEYGIEHNLT